MKAGIVFRYNMESVFAVGVGGQFFRINSDGELLVCHVHNAVSAGVRGTKSGRARSGGAVIYGGIRSIESCRRVRVVTRNNTATVKPGCVRTRGNGKQPPAHSLYPVVVRRVNRKVYGFNGKAFFVF